MQTGLPTQTIVPFGETVLTPDQVSVSDDSSVPTTFEFPSPVYLAPNQAYCFVLLSASNEYNVWISRMGEVDVSTLDKAESEQIIVAQQPLLGSLFKSQNGATWDPAQYEDLKLLHTEQNSLKVLLLQDSTIQIWILVITKLQHLMLIHWKLHLSLFLSVSLRVYQLQKRLH